MEARSKNCPWCGHPLEGDVTRCANCKWSRVRPNTRPAMLAYLFFLLIMLILGLFTLKWALQFTQGVTDAPGERPLVGRLESQRL